MSTHLGACPLDCPDTCVWQLTVEDGKAVGIRGDKEHPFTRGALCGKVNRYLDAVNGPDRLTEPLVRVGPKGEGPVSFRPAGWDEALDRVAAGLRASIDRYGPESVLPYRSGGTLGLVQGSTMGPRLFAYLGASRLRSTICSGAADAALHSLTGGAVGFEPETIVEARLILLWGANLLSTSLHQWPFVAEARARGAYVVAIDPLRTDTAARCDEHVAPLPGTDAALALGLMRCVLDAGATDEEWLAAHTTGWPELRRRLADWPAERAAAVCGLDPSVVRRLGERVATTRPTAVRAGLGLQRHHGAGQAIRAVCALPLLTGDFRYPGGGSLCMTEGHHTVGAGRVARPAGMPAPRARSINMSRLAAVLTGEVTDPPVTSLVVFNANPAVTVPDQARLREGLLRPDLFTAVMEQRWTDTCDYADVVLPATMQPEHLDLHTSYGHHYTTLNVPAVRPPGQALPNTEIFRRLAAALGLDHPRLRDTDEKLVAQLLAGTGIDPGELRARTYVRATGVEVGDAPYAKGGFPTPSGRARLRDPALSRQGVDPLIGYTPPANADPAAAERFPLVLIAAAGRFFLNSTFASQPWHGKRMGPPRVHLHPDDAAARGLSDEDTVRVHNERGSFTAAVTVDTATRPGVAFTYKAYWARLSPGHASVNAVTAVGDTDLGGGPTFHDTRVQVDRATTAAATPR